MKKQIIVRKADEKDWPQIRDLLIQVSNWLAEQGSMQWSGLLAGRDSHETQERIEREQVYLAENADKFLLGRYILYDHPSQWDSDLWGEDKSQDYYYLHRLAVNRNFSGQGISQLLLDNAKETTRNISKKALRLDCRADVEALNRLYSKNGFELVGCRKDYPDGDRLTSFNLYEYTI